MIPSVSRVPIERECLPQMDPQSDVSSNQISTRLVSFFRNICFACWVLRLEEKTKQTIGEEVRTQRPDGVMNSRPGDVRENVTHPNTEHRKYDEGLLGEGGGEGREE